MSADITWGKAMAKIATTIRQLEARNKELEEQREQDNTQIWSQKQIIHRLQAEVEKLQAEITNQVDIRG